MYQVWNETEELKAGYSIWPQMPAPTGLLMVTPDYFDVVDVKNPYMQDNIGNIRQETAVSQWKNLYNVFQQLIDTEVITDVKTVEGVKNLEDMVFCANPAIQWLSEDGEPIVLLSNMQYERRQPEIYAFAQYFREQGVRLLQLPENIKIEGNGDLIPHPGKRALWMGYGYRTDKQVAELVADALQAHVIPLKLVSEHFYHLDTCFCVISPEHVAICKDAFDTESLQKIRAVFPFVYEIPLQEARQNFALNSLVMSSPTGRRYGILPIGNPVLRQHLLDLNVSVIEVDTGEFIKSGGSVYCMKMFLYG